MLVEDVPLAVVKDDVPLTIVKDVPLTAVDVICAKTKRPLVDLTGGKSTLLNEIIGDLLKEFNILTTQPIPDRIDEISLSEQPLKGLGKYTAAQVARLFSAKMPGSVSISAARRGLADTHGLDAALLVALTMEPADKDKAEEWLALVARTYADAAGIDLLPATSSSSQSGRPALSPLLLAGGANINSAEFDHAQTKLRRMAEQQIQAYAEYLAAPPSANHQHQQPGLSMPTTHDVLHKLQQKNIETTQRLDGISAELGPEFIDGIRGIFSPQKARRFDSYWNWARQDVVSWFNSVRVSKLPVDWAAESTQRRILMIANRADDALIALLDGLIHHLDVATQPSAGKSTEAAELLLLLHKIHARCTEALGSTEGSGAQPVYRELSRPSHPATEISVAGKLSYSECSPRPGEPTFAEYVRNVSAKHAEFPPLIHLRQRTQSYTWEYSEEQSAEYYSCLHEQCATAAGVSFANTTVLITGASQGSIGAQVLQGLLSGGSFVIATTTSYAKVMPFYEQLYRDYGAKGSVLIVVPFNQASTQDVSQLVDFIYSTLGRNLDYVLPFAALADYGSDISQLGSLCELSMRLMLTNVMRLLGEIKHAKEVRQWDEWPTLAVLPMSPNHGELGYDGLYGESKAALETPDFNCRAVIGWTRGTGLMSINNPAAEHVERQSHGGRTFSTAEMAFNILGLLHPRIIAMSHLSPIWADLNGGLQRIQNCSRRNAIAMSYFADISVASGHDAGILHKEYGVDPLFNHRQYFTQPPSMSPGHDQLRDLRQLEGMANLDKVIVVTGYGEVGPYGNAETRWEMEAYGEFSLEGCIELAWIMGLIKNAPKGHVGWVDAKTGETVADKDIKRKYEKFILEHTGIRTLEADHLWDVQDPAAQQFKLRNQDKVDIWDNGDGSWSVRFLRGACLMVPKALRFDRLVGAQLPSGWSPERYGIPKDIIQQVDLVTCYAIIATVEALVRSGITDPYELYAYFHVSEVGTSMGSGAGGVHSIRDLDILQETFANSMAAWVNMLLLSSAGPIKTPTGGCASALLSIDVAADTIRQGKARVMMAGAFEGIVDQGSYEFAQMGATCSSTNEEAQGRLPREMSRPSTHSRSGFVETQGAGVVVLMSASAALEFGAPIYAIIAYTGSATDKQGYSLPAPGMGLLTSARQQQQQQLPPLSSLPLLSIEYRKRQLQAELKFINSWASLKTQQEADNSEAVSAIAEQAEARRAAALDTWGIDFWRKNSKISPLRGSLAAWGLCANDIGLASLHGTATVANDLNESKVLDAQLRALGRSPGLAIPAVCQKWLTGHPKGPAAAWMLNGAIQSMRTGLVPGNRNADNIDKELCCEYIFYPSRSIQTPMVKAALLKSYGFGQVGAELLVVHPHYLLATLSEREIEEYKKKTTRREHRAYRYWQDTFAGNHPFFQLKSSPPFSPDMEKQVYLDPLLRAKYDAKTGSYHF
ncbi:thiolase-like protein [Kickxella alabastrina]|uniref:thiolase-like protein n=1 Tax=Kickxella alabastrina TaxID=61397 RepID=UPI00221E9BF1|nr:thiolase-like protein [Kickxella alabastrina]KAI7820874.1 thiolase-like protein [Kickxella alabastrina]